MEEPAAQESLHYDGPPLKVGALGQDVQYDPIRSLC